MTRHVLVFSGIWLGSAAILAAQSIAPVVRVGIMDNWGPAETVRNWTPTANYLAERVGRPFQIFPLGHDEMMVTPAQAARQIWYWLVAAGAAMLLMGVMIIHLLHKSRPPILPPPEQRALPNPRLASTLQRFSLGAGAALVVMGFLTWAGWLLDNETLKSVVPGLTPMNPATALAFILGGLSLGLLRNEQPGRWPRRIGQICAVGVGLVGLLRLCGYLGWDIGIDQVLFHDELGANRMAPNTALNFVLLGLGLVLVNKDTRRSMRPTEWAAVTASTITLIAAVGHAYGVRPLYGIAPYIPMAVNTAMAFILFCLGVLFARPGRGMMAIITSDTAGAAMARNLLPAAIGIPIALGWLRLLGQRAGLYETEVGVSLVALAGIVVFAVLVGWNAGTLHRVDMQRRRAETLLRQAQDGLERQVEERTAELYSATETLRLDKSRSEALLKLHHMTDATMPQITDFTLEEAVRLTQSTIGYLAFLNKDETVLTMHSWSRSAMQECRITDKPLVYPVASTGLWGEAVRQRKAVITNDYGSPNPLKKGCPPGHVKVLRHMNVPVFDGGKIVIVSGVGNKAGPYDESDVRQLTLLMQGMWLLIQRKRAEMELDQHRHHLEALVENRTQELARANGDLKAANNELEAFTYSASHDLRAPLRSMDGFSQALLEDYADRLDDRGQDYLRRVRAGAQRMGHLIDDLLGLSRIGRAEMQREEVNLSDMAQAIVAEIHQNDPRRQAEWVVAPGLIVAGDARLLRIMLENLMGNAWKFTGKCPRARIELGVTSRDGRNVYYVADNGAGFDMAYAGKLFTPFQRLHGVEEFPGTGIGLALVQRIIHRHGGQVWAEGKVNQGATFYFSI